MVTGTFRHSHGQIGELVLKSESKPIGVTPGHMFWSEDRQARVPVGSLRRGETLQTMKGLTRVVSYTMTDRVEPVYNIEVEGSHCYRVGESGVLVHNMSAPAASPPDPACKPECDFALPFSDWGLDPNNLKSRIKKVAMPTMERGVYLKKHEDGLIKIGSAGGATIWFSNRYLSTAAVGTTKHDYGCPILYEIVIDPSTPPASASLPLGGCPAAKGWNARRQRQFDEEYVQRLVPNAQKWKAKKKAQNAVNPMWWDLCRHLFGYKDVPVNFGQFLPVGLAAGGASEYDED
jgi:hypothetical protein